MMAWPDSIVFPDGKAPINGGKLVVNAQDCCCDNGCIPNAATRRFRLAGYTDGDLTPCPQCTNNSTRTPWDGTLPNFVAQFCAWEALLDMGSDFRISGKYFWRGRAWLIEGVSWNLEIQCGYGGGDTMWRGIKTIDLGTPVGDYTRTSGCDATATLTIEEY